VSERSLEMTIARDWVPTDRKCRGDGQRKANISMHPLEFDLTELVPLGNAAKTAYLSSTMAPYTISLFL